MANISSSADCLLRINSQLPNLSGKEGEIARFVLDNAAESLAMTIYELADKVQVSPASITRFTKRMGYQGFNSFKIALAHAVGAREPDPFSADLKSDSPESVIFWVFEQNISTLRNTLKVVSHANLVRTAKICRKARRVYFYGVGSSGFIARDAAARFALLGLESEAFSDPYLQISSAVRLGEEDVAFAISHTGSSRNIIDVLKVAGESGAQTVCITNYSNAPLIQVAQIPLITSSEQKRIHVAEITSQAAQLSIIDSIYFLMAQKLKDGDARALSRLEDYVIDLLRED
ncbi:MAG TPA: MurR/RpiR family transcriptional regulator [Acidobacteriota bacterium]|nr:MurR/RpiR family transcriptional regulator [Acidobacteriota bacterium]